MPTEVEYVARPFEGLAGEPGWVAMREVLPAATASARLTKKHGGGQIVVSTLLPMLWPAWHRADGTVLVGLQTQFASQDVSRDIAQAVLAAVAAEPGVAIDQIDIDADTPRLQDILEPGADFEVSVHDNFDFWDVDAAGSQKEAVDQSLEIMSEKVNPSAAVEGCDWAYWTRMGSREYLRWAMTADEDDLIDALARLQAKRQAGVIDGARYAGAFRACGIIIPVWDLPAGTEADDLAEPCQAFAARLADALATTEPLDGAERRARAGLVARSVTLR